MKKTTKLMCGLCGALGLTLALTGCATVSPIKNENKDIIYNGNSAVMVDGYLYFGNSLNTTTLNDKTDYNNVAKLSYMARLNTNIDLAAKGIDYCPEKVEKVNSEVASHARSFTFVLGDYLYFATPNKEKAVSEGASSHYFNHTTLYRSKLNGDGLKKIYSTTGEVTTIEALKHDNKYYIVMLAGDKLIKIEIGDKLGKAEVVAEKVSQIAIPETYQETNKATSLEWNGDIYFTTAREGDATGTYLKKISVESKEGDEATSLYSGIGKTVTLTGRTKDVVFYTLAEAGKEPELFKLDTNAISGQLVLGQAEDKVYSTASITNLNLIATSAGEKGHIFTSANGKLVVAPKNGTAKAVTLMAGESEVTGYKILAVKDRTIYISTTANIYAVDLSSAFEGADVVECRNIVTMTSISDKELSAFDGEYIYFYAGLETLEVEEGEDAIEEEEDGNVYLYRARVGGTGENNYQLLSKTKNDTRYSK